MNGSPDFTVQFLPIYDWENKSLSQERLLEILRKFLDTPTELRPEEQIPAIITAAIRVSKDGNNYWPITILNCYKRIVNHAEIPNYGSFAHLAVWHGSPEIIEWMRSNKIDINYPREVSGALESLKPVQSLAYLLPGKDILENYNQVKSRLQLLLKYFGGQVITQLREMNPATRNLAADEMIHEFFIQRGLTNSEAINMVKTPPEELRSK